MDMSVFMPERSEFEEWQAGVLMTIGAILVGAIFAMIFVRVFGTFGVYLGFAGGVVATFLFLSFVLYGR
ncbi:hypothetical protein [Natronorubrum bangense]|uniref:DUF8144 domain-containing protein n=2 Tax=Natronorubrum bangense TaxID=61858 RepID=L9WQQ1_9EURY|nr:hypothetical protein [Natronorubrum bangense]ELY51819.1 hypothetical protein C494_01751 [Natronorubrum bangense JCM 10635]QCC54946.1 hypothetical protein DV706_10995 [Natronorubrum bangense]